MVYEETPDPEFNCQRCPVTTILDVEFDDEFVLKMGWLMEQRAFREAGFSMNEAEFDIEDKRALVAIDRWIAEQRIEAERKAASK